VNRLARTCSRLFMDRSFGVKGFNGRLDDGVSSMAITVGGGAFVRQALETKRRLGSCSG
jgi:hypothetical protein